MVTLNRVAKWTFWLGILSVAGASLQYSFAEQPVTFAIPILLMLPYIGVKLNEGRRNSSMGGPEKPSS